MKTNYRVPVRTRKARQPFTRRRVRVLVPALTTMAFLLAFALPVSTEPPNIVKLKVERAQEVLEELRTALLIDASVEVNVVISHPLVFAVRAADIQKSHFVLSMEQGFLLMLEEDELRAALAHELGHVWVFRHHPYLQTERLANSIGQRVVRRDSFEKLYSKLWAYEGASSVAMDQLLVPDPDLRPVGSYPALTTGPP